MTRVLITGATGFIGRRTLDALLAKGHEVHAVSRRDLTCSGVTSHRIDLLAHPEDAESLARNLKPEALLHLAWYAEPGRFWTSHENLKWLGASLALLRAFGAAGGHRIVVAGTCAEYDWSHEIAHETRTPLAPSTLYGACKHALHVAAQVLAEQEGLSLAWGRLFLLYGPGEPTARLIPSVVLPLLAGKVARTTVGTQLRDFMYVDDVAGALVEVLDSGIDGPVNVASGQCVELREMIEVAGRATGRPELLAIGALPLRGAEPARLCADVRRLRDEVGFVPRFGLDEGIRETVNWWRGVAEPR